MRTTSLSEFTRGSGNNSKCANLCPSAPYHGVREHQFRFPRCIPLQGRGLHLDEGRLLPKGVREPWGECKCSRPDRRRVTSKPGREGVAAVIHVTSATCLFVWSTD